MMETKAQTSRVLSQEEANRVSKTAQKLAEIVGMNLQGNQNIITLDGEFEGLSQTGTEFVRDLIIQGVSEVLGREVYGAVSDDGNMVFTFVPDQVCNTLSEETEKSFEFISDKFRGLDDVDLSRYSLAEE